MKRIATAEIEGRDYQFIVDVDGAGQITALRAMDNKGGRAAAVAEFVTVMGQLIEKGLEFHALEQTQRGLLETRILAAAAHERDVVRNMMEREHEQGH